MTKKGYIGLGPETVQAGDIVMVLPGAYAPYILRGHIERCIQRASTPEIDLVLPAERSERLSRLGVYMYSIVNSGIGIAEYATKVRG